MEHIDYETNYLREMLEMWNLCDQRTKEAICFNTIGRDINKQDILIEYGTQCNRYRAYKSAANELYTERVLSNV